MKNYFLLLLLIFFFTTNSQSTPVDDIAIKVSYLIDETNGLKISDLQTKEFIYKWSKQVNLGYTTDRVWVKVEINNRANPTDNFTVRIPKLLTDEIIFYKKNQFQWVINKVGVHHPNKFGSPSGYYFPIHLNRGKNTFYFSSLSPYAHMYSLELVDKEKKAEYDFWLTIRYGVFIGMFLIIVFYNLFLGINFKDKIYFYYSMHGVFIVFAMMSIEGFLNLNYLELSSTVKTAVITFNISMVSIISSIFCIKFLNLKTKHKLFYRILIGLITVDIMAYLGTMLMNFNGYLMTYKLLATITTAYCIIAIITGVNAYREGNESAKFYLIGWSVYFLGIISKALVLFGYIPSSSFINQFYSIAISTEVILMSFALADRYKSLAKDKKKLAANLQSQKGDLDNVILDNKMKLGYNEQIVNKLNAALNSVDIKTDLKSVLNDLTRQRQIEEKKVYFQDNIEVVNDSFRKTLKTNFPQLSPSEIEICALIKLNMKNKEIAEFRNTSEGAVKVARHRIKKKMQIEGKLIDYLIMI
ncbi:7TM diverse intracellular signaling domain-containing protein [Flammeovirga kamogawensis]|uniref:HTH luxR-type domain-containing protein n=1 Tax=Flammeovirga kamogawensis TaxID=373891 RepID=A0ABX8H2J6_9BACT|nr:7TM diverse intracellular signaling domain-containing protein [Flammeovirga kamogawensis]MBB6460325.1 hypothetical protein [Flammeovirga kamogawensis]QWG10134.1 hypothetical protein KM029_20850 [Flammeovirga kamogawensis]TRX65643.1 hypothetical protein EO216_24285 [Flammeovirga kamogawensis]